MRVVIIDDHPLVRMGVASILSLQKDIEVVGEADNVDEGIETINKMQPDLSIVDLKLGRKSGLDIVKNLNSDNNKCKFIVLTSSANEEDFREAEEAKVDGYVLKGALPEELAYAINVVKRGKRYYDPELLEMMMKQQEEDTVEQLTPRERDVLIALGHGYSNSQIASRLYITEFTVKKHVGQILAKLSLSDRTQAALYANNKGLIRN